MLFARMFPVRKINARNQKFLQVSPFHEALE